MPLPVPVPVALEKRLHAEEVTWKAQAVAWLTTASVPPPTPNSSLASTPAFGSRRALSSHYSADAVLDIQSTGEPSFDIGCGIGLSDAMAEPRFHPGLFVNFAAKQQQSSQSTSAGLSSGRTTCRPTNPYNPTNQKAESQAGYSEQYRLKTRQWTCRSPGLRCKAPS